jgi:glycosyltransferase involved in cell wall biosynthesis
MKILYVTSESPLFPAGGIGTYIAYAANAQVAAGHEVFLFTWQFNEFDPQNLQYGPFPQQNVRVLELSGQAIWDRFPHGPWDNGLALVLGEEIERFIAEIDPDVVEGTDYQGPLHGVLSARRTSGNCGKGGPIFATFCHGLILDHLLSDAYFPPAQQWDELVIERQVLKWADVILAPSRHTANRLSELGIRNRIKVVREPYLFSSKQSPRRPMGNRLVHLGRVSFGKGVDTATLFANLMHQAVPVESIKFIGHQASTSFRRHDVKDFILSKLAPALRERTTFVSRLPRAQALAHIGAGDVGLCFGAAETFSYSTVELIDHWTYPMVFAGSPMAEFFPPDMQDLLFAPGFGYPEDFNLVLNKWRSDGPDILQRIRDYNEVALGYSTFAVLYQEAIEEARSARRRDLQIATVGTATAASGITALMATHNPTQHIIEALDSISAQTMPVSQILVCDDGSFDEASLQLLSELPGRYLGLRVLRQPNQGLLGSRNRLISECGTELAVFLDDDDLLAPTFVERCLAVLNDPGEPIDAVSCFRQNFGESDHRVIRDLSDDLMHFVKNDFRMTALIRVAALRRIGFDTLGRNGEADDWDFWLRFRIAGYRFKLIPEFLFFYRFRHGTMSWPWSQGQSALTARLICNRLSEAHAAGILTDSEVSLVSFIKTSLEYTAGSETDNIAPKDFKRFSRLLWLRRDRPLIGGVLYQVFRLISNVARLLR